jgi:hypothetical protein
VPPASAVGKTDPPSPKTPPSAAPPPAAAASSAAPSIPRGKGLPVLVGLGVFFLELKAFDDTKGEFEATIDLRLRWSDPGLRYERGDDYRGFKEYRGKDAETQLSTMWTPNVDLANRLEGAVVIGRRLRVFPSGDVELLTRSSAKYKTAVDAEQFPFDRQYLRVVALSRDDTTDEVLLQYERTDVEFSSAGRDARLPGWQVGLVDLHADVVPGWNGDRYARVTASLFVDREPTTGFGPIFIPLVASLLIPLLAVWMNRATEEGFEIPAFELANMGIGGLFSVIALSFAVYSSYSMIAGGDNTVTRLFALNYAMLSLALAVVVLLFRYNLLQRLFGPYVHREAFLFLMWAMPVLALATSTAFILVAAA